MGESGSKLVRTYDPRGGFLKRVSTQLLREVSKGEELHGHVFQCKLCGGILFAENVCAKPIYTLRSQEDQLSKHISPIQIISRLLQQAVSPSKVDVSNSKRQRVIELILSLARKLKQRQKTVHFAIIYADILMENADVFTKAYLDQD